jgi:hypothetical protein
MSTTSVKIVFENEIRRFKLDQSALGQPFEHLSKIIREAYALDDFELKYVDDENDYCLVTSEEEMKEALRFISKDKILKLFVQRKTKDESKDVPQDVPSQAVETPVPTTEPIPEPVSEPPPSDIKQDSKVKTGDTVHEGTVCDGCETQPIRGLRYVCTSCKCNLCSSCESKNEHPQDHILLKVKVPVAQDFDFVSPFPKWVSSAPQRDPPTIRPRAHFSRDVTIPDGSMWRPGQRVLKTWSIKNVGNVCWPRGTKLVFVNGIVKPCEDEEQPLVPLAAPGEVVDVSVKVQMPDKPGRYTGYYRLSYGPDGIKFGHRIWIDVLVSEPALPEIASIGREVKTVFGKAINVVSKVLKGDKPSQQPEAKSSPQPKEQPSSEPLVPVLVLPPFQYQAELDILTGMGFDTEKSKSALLTHKGNVNAVANAFLAQ